MWEWAGYLCTAALLAYHSVFDLKGQYIPGKSLAAGVVLSCCWTLARVLLESQSWLASGLGLIPGVFFLLLTRAGREQIGKGDAWELIYMGNWLGWSLCVTALGIALSGIFLVSILLLILGKASRSTRIPFVPFLFGGVVIRLLCSIL